MRRAARRRELSCRCVPQRSYGASSRRPPRLPAYRIWRHGRSLCVPPRCFCTDEDRLGGISLARCVATATLPPNDISILCWPPFYLSLQHSKTQKGEGLRLAKPAPLVAFAAKRPNSINRSFSDAVSAQNSLAVRDISSRKHWARDFRQLHDVPATPQCSSITASDRAPPSISG
jgi:hypothetical protein